MNKKFIGTFELSNKTVIITDPCYDTDTWCQGEFDNVKTGNWNAYVKVSEDDYIAELIVYHTEVSDISELDNKWFLQAYTIGVDSGQAGFFQKDKYHAEDDEWYAKCCNITRSKERAGVLESGAIARSGYGDGLYYMYTVKNDDDPCKIIAMKIVFIN